MNLQESFKKMQTIRKIWKNYKAIFKFQRYKKSLGRGKSGGCSPRLNLLVVINCSNTPETCIKTLEILRSSNSSLNKVEVLKTE